MLQKYEFIDWIQASGIHDATFYYGRFELTLHDLASVVPREIQCDLEIPIWNRKITRDETSPMPSRFHLFLCFSCCACNISENIIELLQPTRRICETQDQRGQIFRLIRDKCLYIRIKKNMSLQISPGKKSVTMPREPIALCYKNNLQPNHVKERVLGGKQPHKHI